MAHEHVSHTYHENENGNGPADWFSGDSWGIPNKDEGRRKGTPERAQATWRAEGRLAGAGALLVEGLEDPEGEGPGSAFTAALSNPPPSRSTSKPAAGRAGMGDPPPSGGGGGHSWP